MNYKKVKFKTKAPGGIVENKLEVNTSGLKMWNGVDAYVNAPSVGKSILKVVDPDLGVGINRYFKSDGTEIDTATAAQTIIDMGSVHGSHFHEKEDILGLYDNSIMQGGILSHKADRTATGDKIPWTQIPQGLRGQMRIAGITDSADATVYTDTLFGAHLLGNDEGEALVGNYYIVGRAAQTLSLQGVDYEFVDGSVADVSLKAGDWIILAGQYFTGTSPDLVRHFIVSYIQNTHNNASSGGPGVVELSSGAKTARGALGGTQVIDEYALKKVLKDFIQIQVQEDPINISAGDPLKTVNRIINLGSPHLQRTTAGTEVWSTTDLDVAGFNPLPKVGDIIFNYNGGQQFNQGMYELTSIEEPGDYTFTWVANKIAGSVPIGGFQWGKMYWDTPSSSYIVRKDLSGTATNTYLENVNTAFKEGDIIFESYEWVGDGDGGTSDTPPPGGGIEFEGL